jgi:SAM-dependent methyltransferase
MKVRSPRVSPWQERYVDRFYRSRPGWIEGTIEFHNLCREVIGPGSRILEIGAGPSNPTTAFLATLGPVRGIDLDPDVRSNSSLTEADLLETEALPYPDSSFDACVSNYVLEHVSDPDRHFSEVSRILKAGGCYIFRTPNRRHYTAIGAWLIPHAFHTKMSSRLRNRPDGSHESYRTYYRANSRRALTTLSKETGFRIQELRFIEREPSYGMLARPLFLVGMAYERLVNATPLAGDLRANILGVLRKPAAQSLV